MTEAEETIEPGDEEPAEVQDQVEADVNYEEEEEGEEQHDRRVPQKRKPYTKVIKCNQRIDELATPSKRMFLALWNEHAHILPQDKLVHLKKILQQLYAMSPEETAKYFAELRERAKVAAERRKLKQKLRKYLKEKNKEKQKDRAYCLLKKLLKCGFTYAAQNPIPPLVSIRLRHLSNIILEQLCELRCMDVPDRDVMQQEERHLSRKDKLAKLLISVADWVAIAMERLHYAAQVSIDDLTGQLMSTGRCECTADDSCILEFEPQVASTPRQSPTVLPPPKIEKTTSPAGSLAAECPGNLPYYSFFEDDKSARRRSVDTKGLYNVTGLPQWCMGDTTAGRFELPPRNLRDANIVPKDFVSSFRDSGIWSEGSQSNAEKRGMLLTFMLMNLAAPFIKKGAEKAAEVVVPYVVNKIGQGAGAVARKVDKQDGFRPDTAPSFTD